MNSSAVTDYIAQFQTWEQNFEPTAAQRFFADYADVPFYAVGLYVFLVFAGQSYMKDRQPVNLKPLFIAWNFILAAFSILGARAMIPYFLAALSREGYRHTICEPAGTWWNKGAPGAWMALFALSKIPELMDTVFLVFQKKPVIFLHWYHHTTVMLYCWLAYMTVNPMGIWFASMNFAVHSVMYSYYFFMSLPFTRPLVRPFAQLITLLQIAQMVVGLVCVASAYVYLGTPAGCPGVQANVNRGALVMYASYFLLFAKFFADAYIFKSKKKSLKSKSQ
jgi:elongation of very long chain fatty acids protein 6